MLRDVYSRAVARRMRAEWDPAVPDTVQRSAHEYCSRRADVISRSLPRHLVPVHDTPARAHTHTLYRPNVLLVSRRPRMSCTPAIVRPLRPRCHRRSRLLARRLYRGGPRLERARVRREAHRFASVLLNDCEAQTDPAPDVGCVEDRLLQVMADEFNAVVEDRYAKEVARDVVRLWEHIAQARTRCRPRLRRGLRD